VNHRSGRRFVMKRFGKIMLTMLLLFAIIILLLLGYDRYQLIRLEGKLLSAITSSGEIEETPEGMLFYQEQGEGPTLLLLHGFLSSSQDFNSLANSLSASFHVISVDIYGFGQSHPKDNLSLSKESLARSLVQWMAGKGFSKYHVLGHSMGGEIALNMALIGPFAIESLVHLDSAGTQVSPARRIPTFLINPVFKHYLLQKMVYFSYAIGAEKDQKVLFEKTWVQNKRQPGVVLARLTADDDSGAVFSKLPELKQPALIIWGEEDPIIPLSDGQKLASAIKNSQLFVISGAGHSPHHSQALQVIKAILVFLDSSS